MGAWASLTRDDEVGKRIAAGDFYDEGANDFRVPARFATYWEEAKDAVLSGLTGRFGSFSDRVDEDDPEPFADIVASLGAFTLLLQRALWRQALATYYLRERRSRDGDWAEKAELEQQQAAAALQLLFGRMEKSQALEDAVLAAADEGDPGDGPVTTKSPIVFL